MTSPATVKIERELLQETFDTLEALWDCDAHGPPPCSDDEPCVRCATLVRLSAVLT
jgi:hypothetical protein